MITSTEDFMRRLASKVESIFPLRDGESLDEYTDRVRKEPIYGKRALIGAHLVEVSNDIAAKLQVEKSSWIATARSNFSPGARRDCAVCGKYRFLTHGHHLYPLAQQYADGIREPDQSFVWLCPNHHAMVHLLLDGNLEPEDVAHTAAASVLDLRGDELLRLTSIVGRSAPEGT